jgi:hypothetical protein
MVAPLVLMTVVSLVVLTGAEVVKLVRRVSSIADNALRRAGEHVSAFVQRLGFTPSSALACVVIVLSLAFAAWIRFSRFSSLGAAMATPIDRAPNDVLYLLSPANESEHVAYRQLLSLGVLGTIFGWVAVRRIASRRRERVRPALVAGGIAVAFIMVVMLDFPYRLLWQNEFEKAVFDGQACYVLGTRDGDVRLFCPEGTPRSVVAHATDPKLTRLGTEENIFTAFSRLRH